MDRKTSLLKITTKKNQFLKGDEQYAEQCKETIASLQNEIYQLKDIIKNQNLLMKLKTTNEDNNNDDNINDEYIYNKDETNNYVSEPLINCDYNSYEAFLKADMKTLNDDIINEYENNMEKFYFDQKNLESKIKKNYNIEGLQEKYAIIRSFYEKYMEMYINKYMSQLGNKHLKQKLFEFITNTHLHNINQLKNKYDAINKEKLSLQNKNKKYQEDLALASKQKEEKCQKIFELSNELDKLKRVLSLRIKREKDLEKKLTLIDNFSARNDKKISDIKKYNVKKLFKNQP